MDRYKQMTQSKLDWLEGRQRIKEDDSNLLNLWASVFSEVLELGDEVQEYMISTSEKQKDKVTQEAADVVIYIMSLFHTVGIDMYAAVMDKMAQNHLKHKAKFYNNGMNVHEGRKAAREEWIEEGGYNTYYAVNLLGESYERSESV